MACARAGMGRARGRPACMHTRNAGTAGHHARGHGVHSAYRTRGQCVHSVCAHHPRPAPNPCCPRTRQSASQSLSYAYLSPRVLSASSTGFSGTVPLRDIWFNATVSGASNLTYNWQYAVGLDWVAGFNTTATREQRNFTAAALVAMGFSRVRSGLCADVMLEPHQCGQTCLDRMLPRMRGNHGCPFRAIAVGGVLPPPGMQSTNRCEHACSQPVWTTPTGRRGRRCLLA